MKVLHFITGLGAGGAEAMLAKVVRHSPGLCHAVVSLRDEGHHGPALVQAGVELHCLGLNRPAGLLAFPLRVAAIVRRSRPDLIQGWMNHGNLLALIGAKLARSAAPVLWNVRQSLGDMRHEKRATRAIIRIDARLSRAPAGIVYNSRAGAEQHEALGFDPSKRKLIPNGFEVDQFHPDAGRRAAARAALGVGDGEVLVGLVARLHSMKNHAGFLDAAARVLAEAGNVRFLLIGSGTGAGEPWRRSLALDPAVAGATLFLGQRSDLADLTRALDIACNVSVHGEGFPNAVGEAMASAVPCAVTDVGDSAAIVADTGIVCRSGTPEAIAEAILELVRRGPEGRARLGTAARQRILDNYSMKAVAAQYEQYYRDVLGRSGSAAVAGDLARTGTAPGE